jgi:anaerobic magnesium-protoporphyrin IX monomethyl ester cyclase
MSTVLFTHSYFLRFDPKQWKRQQPYPPLATLYAAAAARKDGHSVQLHDTMFDRSPEQLRAALRAFRPDVLVIYDDGFNYLTKMCLTNMREAAFAMCRMAAEEGIGHVLVSSSDATDHADDYLDHGATWILAGEGEQTLTELLRGLEQPGFDYRSVDGLVGRPSGTTERTRPRRVLTDPDVLPMPAWDLVDMEAYRRRWKKSTGYFSLNISTTRGCPFHCNWCAKPIYGNRYQAHSPQRTVEEMVTLAGTYGAEHFWITDDIFGLKPGWISTFAALASAAGLRIPFTIQARVDLLLKEDNITALANAGCHTAWVGAESGSQKILDAMDKGTTVEQIAAATSLLKKHGIRAAFFLQFGYPGETQEDIEATVRMVGTLRPDDIGVSISYPLPGTPFYDRVRSELKEKANWTDSDDLALLFRNTYPAAFYKALQRYVHRRFREQQGLADLRSLVSRPAGITSERLQRISKLPYYISGRWYFGYRMSRSAAVQK